MIGSGELIWGVLVKLVPLKFFQCMNFRERHKIGKDGKAIVPVSQMVKKTKLVEPDAAKLREMIAEDL